MSRQLNFQEIPDPDTTVAGRNHPESSSPQSLTKQARLWMPRGAKETPVATLGRFAVRLIDRLTGKAYSADELVSPETIVAALQGAAADAARIGVELLPETAVIAETQSLTTAQKAVARENLGAVNNQTPVLVSKNTSTYLEITSSDALSDVYGIEDYSGYIYNFVSHPEGVTQITYNNSNNLEGTVIWLAGLPNCATLSFNGGATWTALSVSDGENITTLDCSGSSISTAAVPAGLTGLESLTFNGNTSLTGLTFTAAAHPALASVDVVGCSALNTANVDALLVSLEAANPSTMSAAFFAGNGNGTPMTGITHTSTNVNVVLTRTAGNLAQLVVQPTLALSYLTTTDGPIGLIVTGNTTTGAIIAKTVTVNTIAASVISFSTYPYQSKSLSAASYNFTSASAAAGKTVKLYFTQTYVGALAVTWFSGITWADGAPTYSNGTVTIVTLVATGASTYNGSFTTLGTLITATTGTELIAAINGNANAATMVTASSGGTNSGQILTLASTKIGNVTISKLVARGWTVDLTGA